MTKWWILKRYAAPVKNAFCVDNVFNTPSSPDQHINREEFGAVFLQPEKISDTVTPWTMYFYFAQSSDTSGSAYWYSILFSPYYGKKDVDWL